MAYGYNIVEAQTGQIADASNRIVDSFTAEAVIGFGLPLMRGTLPQEQVLPWAGTVATPMVGVSVFTQTQATGRYPVDTAVSVITEGRVYVHVVDAIFINAGERAYINVTNGSFTNVSAANLLVGKFLTTGNSAGGLFVLELNPARI
jgi:hypothetical protein